MGQLCFSSLVSCSFYLWVSRHYQIPKWRYFQKGQELVGSFKNALAFSACDSFHGTFDDRLRIRRQYRVEAYLDDRVFLSFTAKAARWKSSF